MKTKSKKLTKGQENAFTSGGLVLLTWGLVNTFVGIYRYGLEMGGYWWFCNLALVGIGIGLLIRSRGVLTGFLAIACFTQVFWLFDNLVRQIRGRGYFGLVDFMYRPGYPVDEFILSHYHYFTLPIALIALMYLPQKKNHTVKLIAIFNPFIFAVSYFAFPASQNVNCIHRACFESVSNWEGPLYSLSFWLVVFAMNLLIGYFLNDFLLKVKLNPQRQQIALRGFVGITLAAIAVVAQDTHYKMSLPSFTCAAPEQTDGVLAGCQYTKVHYTGSFMLTYFLKNETKEDQFCKVGLQMGENVRTLNSGAAVLAESQLSLNTPLDIPNADTAAKVLVKCRPLSRSLSSN